MIEAKGYCCTMLEVIGNHCIRGQGLLHGGRDERQQLHEQDPGFFQDSGDLSQHGFSADHQRPPIG